MAPKRRAALKEPTARRSKRIKADEPVSTTTLITQPASGDAALFAVFGTTELLENILFQGDCGDVFVAQRVSRKFKDVIAGSMLLQQRMFLRSCVPVESWTLRYTHPLSAYGYPVHSLTGLRRGLHDTEFVPTHSESISDAIKQLTPIILCPLAKVAGGEGASAFGPQERDESCRIDLTQLQERPGSWRQMLLTDPPCKSVTFEATLNFESPGDEADPSLRIRFEGIAQDSEGVKLGTLVDAILAAKKKGGSTCEITNGELTNKKGKRRRGDLDRKDVSARDLERYRVQGDSIQNFSVWVSLSGMVVPTQSEWDQVRRLARMA